MQSDFFCSFLFFVVVFLFVCLVGFFCLVQYKLNMSLVVEHNNQKYNVKYILNPLPNDLLMLYNLKKQTVFPLLNTDQNFLTLWYIKEIFGFETVVFWAVSVINAFLLDYLWSIFYFTLLIQYMYFLCVYLQLATY